MERLHVSVSRRSLFPLLMALFGALLCIGMVQRFRDPLYDMTLEYWLFYGTRWIGRYAVFPVDVYHSGSLLCIRRCH